MPIIGVMPMPAEMSTRGAPGAGRQITERHGDVEQVADPDVVPDPVRHLAGRAVPIASTGLTAKVSSSAPGALTRLYCRSWRAPSGSVTPTETYCAATGLDVPSAATVSRTAPDGSSTRATTRARR